MAIKNELKPKALISINPLSDSLEVEDFFSEEDICRSFGVPTKNSFVGVDFAKKDTLDRNVTVLISTEQAGED
ncbi:hypothetical protein [Shewanella cutis]|uniref:Uncharacterized protein n=1 Tax=Shewanella cutis TaxID=2766780 RepID=A0ABS9QPU9_9GAMM|nr:hypothetical protein [Shewanella sp. PS-2]MCG9962360.1 hypothetical protein [Shewanella sp. PS-2]